MKSNFLSDFKKFAMKGNVIDMAVGVIIGGAFGKIVTSIVNDIIMPPIGLLVGGMNFKDLKWVMQSAKPEVLNEAGEVVTPAVAEVTLNYGNFLQQTFDFLIIAMSIFLVIKLITKVSEMTKKKEEEAEQQAESAQALREKLLALESAQGREERVESAWTARRLNESVQRFLTEVDALPYLPDVGSWPRAQRAALEKGAMEQLIKWTTRMCELLAGERVAADGEVR